MAGYTNRRTTGLLCRRRSANTVRLAPDPQTPRRLSRATRLQAVSGFRCALPFATNEEKVQEGELGPALARALACVIVGVAVYPAVERGVLQ